jgi:hypothetical protein
MMSERESRMATMDSTGWTASELRDLDGRRELEIAATRSGSRVPIWVVVDRDRVFVRTWHRRTTGWYGRAAASGRAWIWAAGDPIQVLVTAVGTADADAVDRGYRAKYGDAGAGSMVTAEAAASTLRLSRADDGSDA